MSQITGGIPVSGPGSGSVTDVVGGANISITGSPTTVPIVNVSGTTNHAVQVGNAGGSLTSLPVGTNGEVLLGSSGANPTFATLTSPDGSVAFTPGAGTLALTTVTGTNKFPITPYVVGPVGQAGYQTIQSGMDAANAAGGGSVYIQAGMYTENLTFYPDVQLIGVTGNSDETGVGTDITITGQHTPSDTGYTTISNIYLENNTDIFFSTDAGTCVIALQNCNVAISGSGYTFNLVNWTGQLNKYDVQDASVNNGVVNNTAGAPILFQNCTVGAGTAVSMTTSGNIQLKRVSVVCPWTAGSGTLLFCDYANFQSTVTVNGTAGGAFYFCRFTSAFVSGGAGLVYNGTGITEVNNCVIDSTATYAIDGTGTSDLILGAIDFVESTGINPTLTGVVSLGGFLPGSFGTVGQVFASNGPFVVPSFQSIATVGAVTSVNAGANISITGTATAPIVNVSGTTIHDVLLGTGTTGLTSLANGTTGQVLTAQTGANPIWAASAGDVTSIAGTANQITVSSPTGAVTLSIPSTFIAPGSIASTTTLTSGTGLTVTTGGITSTGTTTLSSLTGGVVISSSAGVLSNNAITQFDVLVGGATNAITSVSPSTAGFVLTSNGTAANPTFQAIPAAGVTSITGTANQITASAATGAVTLSTPATFIAPGSIASTSTITAATGLTVTAGGETVAGGSTITGTILFNTTGTAATTIGSTGAGALILDSGTAGTTIATGTTGPIAINPGTTGAITVGTTSTGNVSIGNTTGTTSIQFGTGSALTTFVDWTSWTPTIFGETTPGTTTYTTQFGTYSRIGNIVTVTFYVTCSAATGTGNVTIRGLPFTIHSLANYNPMGSVVCTGLTYPVGATATTLYGVNNSTSINILCVGTASAGFGFLVMANASLAFYGQLTYRV